MKVTAITTFLILGYMIFGGASVHGADYPQIQYQSKIEFLNEAFEGVVPKWKMIKLNRSLKTEIKNVLEHSYRGGRIRYWWSGLSSLWIFDEIGKELPITIGVFVTGDAVSDISVLVYREERGQEVHQGFFTKQFNGAFLTDDTLLSKEIDGITGATLSVDAMIRVAKLALFLHGIVKK